MRALLGRRTVWTFWAGSTSLHSSLSTRSRAAVRSATLASRPALAAWRFV